MIHKIPLTEITVVIEKLIQLHSLLQLLEYCRNINFTILLSARIEEDIVTDSSTLFVVRELNRNLLVSLGVYDESTEENRLQDNTHDKFIQVPIYHVAAGYYELDTDDFDVLFENWLEYYQKHFPT